MPENTAYNKWGQKANEEHPFEQIQLRHKRYCVQRPGLLNCMCPKISKKIRGETRLITIYNDLAPWRVLKKTSFMGEN